MGVMRDLVFEVKEGYYIKSWYTAGSEEFFISVTNDLSEAIHFNSMTLFDGADDFTNVMENLTEQTGGRLIGVVKEYRILEENE